MSSGKTMRSNRLLGAVFLALAGGALAGLVLAGPGLMVGPAAAQEAKPAEPAAPAAPEAVKPETVKPDSAKPEMAKPESSAPETGQAQTPGSGPDPAAVVTVDLTSRPVLIWRGKSKWDDGFEAITGSFAKLREEAKRLGLEAAGKPLTNFIESDDESFTFDAMLPLGAEPAGKTAGAGFSFGKSPGGKAMKFEHRGAYAEIEVTYEAITAYLDEKGLLAQDSFIEEYLSEPKNAEDTDLSVDIYVFLK